MSKLRAAVFLLPLLMLAACTSPERPRYPDITFGHLPPLRLDVASVEVVRAYTPTSMAPNIEQSFPTPPMQAMERWVRDRLQAVGTSGVATVTITDASATESRLPRTDGIRGAFTTDQTERYTARVEMTVEASRVDPDGARRNGTAVAQATRSRTAAEDATMNQRETIWFEMTEAMMREFDAAMATEVQKNLGAFLR